MNPPSSPGPSGPVPSHKAASPAQPARYFYNGRIFTADPDQPEADAMVVANGRILWIGRQTDANPGTGVERVDLQGRRVIPGIIDAHMHPLFLAETAQQIACLPPAARSVGDIIEAVRRRRQQLGREAGRPAPGSGHAGSSGPLPWILGWGYDEGKLAEGRAPTRRDLDRGASDVPVVLTRICYHVVAVNSKALELAGITRETPDPPGGRIDRDEHGEPTGILRESARYLVLERIPTPPPAAWAQMLADLSPFLFARGITGITDMMARRRPVDDLALYQDAHARGLRQRVVLYYLWEHLRDEPASALRPEALPGPGQPVAAGGIKVFADGSISGRTAWVDPPFSASGAPSPEDSGLSMTSAAELLEAAAAARRLGVQLAVHAMGNRAIDLVVNTLARLPGRPDGPGWLDGGPSIRLEHATLASPAAMAVAARAGIAFVPQPIFLFAEVESYLSNLGPERASRAYALRSMLAAGVQVAMSSDAPATSWADPASPFANLKMAVTRRASHGMVLGPDEAIPLDVALTLYTREAARVTRIPGTGQLKAGFAADFVVLDRDVLAAGPDTAAELDAVRVLATYLDGERVYEA
ncbi:amidohydrolase [Thermaerobacter subterraneus]|uniref:TIM-barrel fold metal-dependent hydrolase n=1 Tax=Thermaerobacter subterraneus DSM 13965 TaxID=867903 RepID=K6Q2K9_9FIRM|nr:amidohydrolase [Thermaerobacter subterraneus]EKP95259.1 putative TIM-barrel fold metal-dependent hydrolase [Thermaerobacter subterraneus DSM 13965]